MAADSHEVKDRPRTQSSQHPRHDREPLGHSSSSILKRRNSDPSQPRHPPQSHTIRTRRSPIRRNPHENQGSPRSFPTLRVDSVRKARDSWKWSQPEAEQPGRLDDGDGRTDRGEPSECPEEHRTENGGRQATLASERAEARAHRRDRRHPRRGSPGSPDSSRDLEGRGPTDRRPSELSDRARRSHLLAARPRRSGDRRPTLRPLARPRRRPDHPRGRGDRRPRPTTLLGRPRSHRLLPAHRRSSFESPGLASRRDRRPQRARPTGHPPGGNRRRLPLAPRTMGRPPNDPRPGPEVAGPRSLSRRPTARKAAPRRPRRRPDPLHLSRLSRHEPKQSTHLLRPVRRDGGRRDECLLPAIEGTTGRRPNSSRSPIGPRGAARPRRSAV